MTLIEVFGVSVVTGILVGCAASGGRTATDTSAVTNGVTTSTSEAGPSGSTAIGTQTSAVSTTSGGSTVVATTATTRGSTSAPTAAGTTTIAPTPPNGSGVYGVATAGPTCPVERPDKPCPPVPVSAMITAQDSSGRPVASTRSDTNGKYALGLAPGQYLLTVNTGNLFPRCPSTSVTVPAGAAIRVDINCDTGIR